MNKAELKEQVRRKYASLARLYSDQGETSCYGGAIPGQESSCCSSGADTVQLTEGLYNLESEGLPGEMAGYSLGCGNPVALADLLPGEVVLDLGSGSGLDVLLSARRVAPGGKAIGLDMTDEMLKLARENQRKAGVPNAEFLKGDMENIPLPENAVDVVLSNCVINLAADKDQVLREAYRVLKPGGRLAVYDIVVEGHLPQTVRESAEAYVGCVAGALSPGDYRSKLEAAGFQSIDITVNDVYLRMPQGQVASAFVRAVKPGQTT